MYLTILCHRLQAYKGSVTQKKVSDPSLTDPFPSSNTYKFFLEPAFSSVLLPGPALSPSFITPSPVLLARV